MCWLLGRGFKGNGSKDKEMEEGSKLMSMGKDRKGTINRELRRVAMQIRLDIIEGRRSLEKMYILFFVEHIHYLNHSIFSSYSLIT